jgi:hypothetical protein
MEGQMEWPEIQFDNRECENIAKNPEETKDGKTIY